MLFVGVAAVFEVLEAVVAGGSRGEEACFAGEGVGETPFYEGGIVIFEEDGFVVEG